MSICVSAYKGAKNLTMNCNWGCFSNWSNKKSPSPLKKFFISISIEHKVCNIEGMVMSLYWRTTYIHILIVLVIGLVNSKFQFWKHFILILTLNKKKFSSGKISFLCLINFKLNGHKLVSLLMAHIPSQSWIFQIM